MNLQHKGYLRHLRNSFLVGTDNYPRMVHEAYNILRRREEDLPAQGIEGDGVSFVQSGERRDTSNVRCYSCQQMGHYANSPESQSTVDIFCNPSLVENIRRVKDRMRIQCNAGTRVTNLVGDLPGYGPIWLDSRAIANVLSLKLLKERYHVQYNSNKKEGFGVTKPNGEQFKFIQSPSGLHYLDTTYPDRSKNVHTTLVVNTVAENKKNYTNNDYLCALRARELQITVGHPSTATFVDLLKRNVIANCPITPADVEAAKHIFRPDIGSLKGKTT